MKLDLHGALSLEISSQKALMTSTFADITTKFTFGESGMFQNQGIIVFVTTCLFDIINVYQIEVLITNNDFYLKQTNDCTEESYFELWCKIKCIRAIQRNCVHRRSQPWLKQTFTRWISFCSHTFYIITTNLCLKNVM